VAEARIAVIAGNRSQFELWAKANREKAGPRRAGGYARCFYASTVEMIQGSFVSEIVRTGTWQARRDLREIEDTLRLAQLCWQPAREDSHV
jgi:hypothetical protein